MTALALIGLCGSPAGKAAAMQTPKIGTVICKPGSEIDPYSFWSRVRQQDISKIVEKKYEELKSIEQLAQWLTCSGFEAKIKSSLDNRYSYFVNAHFSRLKRDKSLLPPIWGFDIPIFGGAWGYNIEIYFDKKNNLSDAVLKKLWN